MEVERLQEKYNLDVRFAPYLLDPSTPPEGKPRKRYSSDDSPPSEMELRGERLGVKYNRGREWTSNSLLAHEASEHVTEHEPHEVAWNYHRRLFKSYFTDLSDIGKQDLLLDLAKESGVNVDSLRASLDTHQYQQQVMDALNWARQVGVTGVPTFVFDEQYGLVGAQDLQVMETMMERLGKVPK